MTFFLTILLSHFKALKNTERKCSTAAILVPDQMAYIDDSSPWMMEDVTQIPGELKKLASLMLTWLRNCMSSRTIFSYPFWISSYIAAGSFPNILWFCDMSFEYFWTFLEMKEALHSEKLSVIRHVEWLWLFLSVILHLSVVSNVQHKAFFQSMCLIDP